MLFGLGKGKSEDVDIGKVSGVVGTLFNEKIRMLYVAASKLLGQIEDAKNHFIRSCERFDLLSADPDLEDEYFTKASTVVNQKKVYVSALKRIVLVDADARPNEPKDYYFYKRRLAEAEDMIGNILKTNANFRQVVYSYSRYLEHFKQDFAYLESAVKSLRAEIERMDPDVNEYEAILFGVDELASLVYERYALNAEQKKLSALQETGKTEGRDRILKLIAEKKKEIDAAEEKMRDANSGIINTLNSISKAARRYDYSSLNKIKIEDYIRDPEKMLVKNDGYGDMYSQMRSLYKSVEDGSIALKNRNEALRALKSILDGKIAEYLGQIKLLEPRISYLKLELGELESNGREIEAVENINIDKEKRLLEVKKRAVDLENMLEPKKRDIETRIYGAYKKRLSIKLGETANTVTPFEKD